MWHGETVKTTPLHPPQWQMEVGGSSRSLITPGDTDAWTSLHLAFNRREQVCDRIRELSKKNSLIDQHYGIALLLQSVHHKTFCSFLPECKSISVWPTCDCL